MTAGIGEALQRSAASFNAANTSLEGAISVITTANSVVQNPEAVGTAMKTLSARIRGSKVELEELGEAEEDVVNLTSKLRREVKAMTGFDIMENEDTYKSIDEIIIGIGKHWKELTDIQQAALAEDLAGKRNSNVLIALLQNAELVEEVYDKATHSANSAAREQENYMMSIQYSLDRFNASMQEIEADLVSSQLVKDIVDIGTTIVNFLDAIVEHIGLLGAGATVAGIASLVKNFKELKAALESAVVLGKAAQLMSVGQAEEVAVTEALAVATEHLSFAQAQAVLTTNGMTAAEAKDILTKAGYTGATVGATASTKAFTTALLANVKAMGAMLVSNPVLLALVAITAAVAGVAIAFDAATVSVEESKKKLDEYGKSVSDLKSELEQLRSLEEKTPKDNKRIEYLERELQIQERLLEIEQQRYYKNLTERTFANAFDPDNIATQQDKNAARETNNGGTARYIADLDRQVKKLRDLDDQIKKVGEDSDEFEKLENKRKKALSKGDDYYSALLDEYKTYAQQEEQLTEALSAKTSSGFNMLTGKAREDAQKSLLYAADELREITETLRAFEITKGEYDPFNVVTGIEFEPVVNEIKNVVNSSGDLETAQKRLLAQFPSLEGMCTKYGITLEELVEHYYNLEEAAEEANEAIGDSPLFDQSTFSEEVNKLDALQSAYNSFVENSAKDKSKANLDIADVEGLREVFGDITGFDFNNFELIVTADTSGVDDIQKAFDDAITAYANYKISLEGITEETKDMIRTQLELEGATHESAQAFVDAKLEEANAADFATQSEEAFQAKLRESINIASLTKTQIKQEMDELQRGGSVDLSIRPVIDTSQLPAEWGEEPGNIATLLTNTFANEDATVAMNFTPIMTDENGNYIGALTPDELEEYAWEVLHGAEDSLHLQIGAEFTGADAIAQAEEAAERIHKLQAVYYEQAGEDHFAEFVEEDTYALMAEAEQLGISSEALARYKLSKIDIGNVPIDTAVDRAQLLALVQMLGVTGDEVIQLSRLIALLNGGEIMARERRENIINRINEIIAESVSKAANVEVKYDYDKAAKSAKSGGSKAGKEAGDAYVKAFEEELKALEEQRDAGLLSEKQFLEKYKALIEKYFKDVDGYGEEYAKRMADYFKRTISYLESVFSAVGTLLDKRISAAQKGKDAAVQALNDEKDAAAEAYQSQIDHIDELIEAKEEEIDLIDEEIERYQDQIKAIDDQIDALEEANQKRQQAINLQKAQYELEKSQNQRTRLIYKDGQLVKFANYKRHYIGQRVMGH